MKSETQKDPSTEEKIKTAARKLFTKKGYMATKTRDIAAEAGINLALLNYYFRSKEKLFDIIMLESLMGFVRGMKGVLNEKDSSLEEKTKAFVKNYIDLLSEHPNIPLFILSELRANPDDLVNKVGLKDYFQKSYFRKQLTEAAKKSKTPMANPLHLVLNIVSLTIFPYIANPIVKGIGNIDQAGFNQLMQERKELIPEWIKSMLKG